MKAFILQKYMNKRKNGVQKNVNPNSPEVNTVKICVFVQMNEFDI